MPESRPLELSQEVRYFLTTFAKASRRLAEYGDMSTSIYDTAWVSVITRSVEDQKQWAFPAGFWCILNHQQLDWTWGEAAEPLESNIPNTSTGLWTICWHEKDPLQLGRVFVNGKVQLRSCIEKGVAALHGLLQAWDISQAMTVGFEVLIPSILRLLARDFAISFEYGNRDQLRKIQEQKLAKIDPTMLYGNAPVSLLHSAEAFYGLDAFSLGRLSTRIQGGSLMNSPAATAAYLMSCETWDDRAEAYLSSVSWWGAGVGNGAVPTAFPSSIFEMTWVCD